MPANCHAGRHGRAERLIPNLSLEAGAESGDASCLTLPFQPAGVDMRNKIFGSRLTRFSVGMAILLAAGCFVGANPATAGAIFREAGATRPHGAWHANPRPPRPALHQPGVLSRPALIRLPNMAPWAASLDGGALRDDEWGRPPFDDNLSMDPELAGAERLWTGIDMLYVRTSPPALANTAAP